jgi:predicted HD phosphohydrolase
VERNIEEYQTVILAALLHDVGKLLWHGSFAVLDKGQHPKFSSNFVAAFSETFSQISNVPLLRELVQHHHEGKQYFAPEFLVQEIKDDHARTMVALVSKADNLSRGCSSEQWQDYKETPLASILERVNRVEEQGVRLEYHARSLCPPASLSVIFPEEFSTYEPGELNQHIKQFN